MRLNLEISNAKMDALKALQKQTGAGSMKDLVNNALTIFEWTVNETAKGNEIAAVNEKEEVYRVLITPLLENAKNSSHPPKAASVEIAEPAGIGA
jgi:hypothetical protein